MMQNNNKIFESFINTNLLPRHTFDGYLHCAFTAYNCKLILCIATLHFYYATCKNFDHFKLESITEMLNVMDESAEEVMTFT